MAKRIMKWSLTKNTLGVSKVVEGEDAKNAKIVLTAEFDLVLLYPDFESYNDVQQQIIVYGTKQKLADSGASEIADYGSKVKKAKTKWDELLSGKWTGSRVNGTGAAERKKLVKDISNLVGEVSLNGLTMKKALSALDGQAAFTEEDEVKLQEFLAIKIEMDAAEFEKKDAELDAEMEAEAKN